MQREPIRAPAAVSYGKITSYYYRKEVSAMNTERIERIKKTVMVDHYPICIEKFRITLDVLTTIPSPS